MSLKLVEGLPDSVKDWKENFGWVEGDNLGLFCAGWPEVIKDDLKAKMLSSADQEALEKVKSFTGFHRLRDLFDNVVLRVAGISSVKPSAKDRERADKLILGGSAAVGEHKTTRSEVQEGSSARPAKRLREDSPHAPLARSSGTSPLSMTAIM